MPWTTSLPSNSSVATYCAFNVTVVLTSRLSAKLDNILSRVLPHVILSIIEEICSAIVLTVFASKASLTSTRRWTINVAPVAVSAKQ